MVKPVNSQNTSLLESLRPVVYPVGRAVSGLTGLLSLPGQALMGLGNLLPQPEFNPNDPNTFYRSPQVLKAQQELDEGGPLVQQGIEYLSGDPNYFKPRNIREKFIGRGAELAGGQLPLHIATAGSTALPAIGQQIAQNALLPALGSTAASYFGFGPTIESAAEFVPTFLKNIKTFRSLAGKGIESFKNNPNLAGKIISDPEAENELSNIYSSFTTGLKDSDVKKKFLADSKVIEADIKSGGINLENIPQYLEDLNNRIFDKNTPKALKTGLLQLKDFITNQLGKSIGQFPELAEDIQKYIGDRHLYALSKSGGVVKWLAKKANKLAGNDPLISKIIDLSLNPISAGLGALSGYVKPGLGYAAAGLGVTEGASSMLNKLIQSPLARKHFGDMSLAVITDSPVQFENALRKIIKEVSKIKPKKEKSKQISWRREEIPDYSSM